MPNLLYFYRSKKLIAMGTKLRYSLFIFAVLFYINSEAQNNVGIGTTTPDANSILELSATQTGLLVFDTTLGQFWFWDGTQWAVVGSGSGNAWNLPGNAGIINPASPAIYGTSTIGI